MFHIDRLMRLSPVIPVLVVDDPAKAQPMARELLKRGCRLLEVTLRTPAALEVIAEMAKVEGVVVGAGTVLNPKDLENSLAVGAKFIVAPGLTERLSHAAIESGIAYLPGVANAGDIMRGLDLGLTHFKFFPAMASGGIPALKNSVWARESPRHFHADTTGDWDGTQFDTQ